MLISLNMLKIRCLYSAFLLLLLNPLNSIAQDINNVRSAFHKSINDKKAAETFYTSMNRNKSTDPLMLAYLGGSKAMMAKHVWNPVSKLSYLKGGLSNLNRAISSNSDNLEIRFIRFSIEHYIPSYLGLSSHLENDKAKMLELAHKKKLGKMDSTHSGHILWFLNKTGRFTPVEMKTIEQALATK